jgi:hypothetical protein
MTSIHRFTKTRKLSLTFADKHMDSSHIQAYVNIQLSMFFLHYNTNNTYNVTIKPEICRYELFYLSIYLSIYGSTALVDFHRFFTVLIYKSVGLFGRGISRSQRRNLFTEGHKHRMNAHRHPCLEWDSNPRSQCSSGRRRFALDSAATAIGRYDLLLATIRNS